MTLIIQKLCASHDVNGNPRRVWAVYMPEDGEGLLIDAVDEGYDGKPRDLCGEHVVELPSVVGTASEDEETLRRGRYGREHLAPDWYRLHCREAGR